MMNASKLELIRSTNQCIAFVVPQYLPTQVRVAFNKAQGSEDLVNWEIQLRCTFAANVVTLNSLRLGSKSDHSC